MTRNQSAISSTVKMSSSGLCCWSIRTPVVEPDEASVPRRPSMADTLLLRWHARGIRGFVESLAELVIEPLHLLDLQFEGRDVAE